MDIRNLEARNLGVRAGRAGPARGAMARAMLRAMLRTATLLALPAIPITATAADKPMQARGVEVLRAKPKPSPAPVAIEPAPAPVTPTPAPVAPSPVMPTPAPVPPPPVPTVMPSPAPVPVPTPVATPVPVAKACPRPLPADVALAAAATAGSPDAGFNRALRNRLKGRPARVVVDLARPFPLGEDGPAALKPWLDEARAKGGIVSVEQYCEAARGFFSWLRKVFSGGEKDGYGAVDGYDIVLHAEGISQQVTQVEFRLRTGG